MNADVRAIRPDGRFADDLRRIGLEYEIIGNNGYIMLAHGLTRVRATLLRPKDRGAFSVSLVFHDTARAEAIGDRQSYIMQTRITEIFAPIVLSDSPVSIELAVLGDDGSLLAALVNATTLCLCFHGVALADMCLAACVNENYDLTTKEQGRGFAATVAYLANSDRVIYFYSVGKCQKDALKAAVERGIACCGIIGRHFAEFLNAVSK
ncbi:exosome complex component RRP41 [Pancytospora philotis]|nr:exosome complex component RRP41 [Pancytospora philotis]